jgi:hypothetical protein
MNQVGEHLGRHAGVQGTAHQARQLRVQRGFPADGRIRALAADECPGSVVAHHRPFDGLCRLVHALPLPAGISGHPGDLLDINAQDCGEPGQDGMAVDATLVCFNL